MPAHNGLAAAYQKPYLEEVRRLDQLEDGHLEPGSFAYQVLAQLSGA